MGGEYGIFRATLGHPDPSVGLEMSTDVSARVPYCLTGLLIALQVRSAPLRRRGPCVAGEDSSLFRCAGQVGWPGGDLCYCPAVSRPVGSVFPCALQFAQGLSCIMLDSQIPLSLELPQRPDILVLHIESVFLWTLNADRAQIVIAIRHPQ